MLSATQVDDPEHWEVMDEDSTGTSEQEAAKEDGVDEEEIEEEIEEKEDEDEEEEVEQVAGNENNEDKPQDEDEAIEEEMIKAAKEISLSDGTEAPTAPALHQKANSDIEGGGGDEDEDEDSDDDWAVSSPLTFLFLTEASNLFTPPSPSLAKEE